MFLLSLIRVNCVYLVLPFMVGAGFLACHNDSHGHTHLDTDNAHASVEVLKITNLLRDSLALADNVEIVVSHLEVPPGTTLPAHYHPGEEFVYVLEGSGELYIDDQTIVLKAGDLYKVPFEKVHSFSTLEDQAKAVVFRVHREGQPDRILVE